MYPAPKVFTKASPCTKLHLWNCFRGVRGWGAVLVPLAHAEIGVNAPRVMERNGYLVKERRENGDYYVMTHAGRVWLVKGILSYLKNHPSHSRLLNAMPDAAELSTAVRRVSRTRPA